MIIFSWYMCLIRPVTNVSWFGTSSQMTLSGVALNSSGDLLRREMKTKPEYSRDNFSLKRSYHREGLHRGYF